MYFNSIVINHKIIYDAVMKKTPLPTLFLFWNVRGQCQRSPGPCISLSAVIVSLHYLPRCLRSTVTCGKPPNIVTWSVQ